jgi:hypothetical protein
MFFPSIFIVCLLHTYFIKATYSKKNVVKNTNDSENASEIRKLHNALNAIDYNNPINETENVNVHFSGIDNDCRCPKTFSETNGSEHERISNVGENTESNFNQTIDPALSRVPSAKKNEIFNDYVLNSTVNKSKNVHQRIYLWPQNISTGYYEVPIILNSVTKITKQRLLYVFGYLSRGVKISFRDPLPNDEVIVNVTENNMQGCWANLGRGDGHGIIYMNIPPLLCNSIYTVLHEVMHILGCVHAHERNSGKYIYFRQSDEVYIATHETIYDELSVMIYPNQINIVKTNNSQRIMQNIARGRQSFISRCDWNFIIQLYPSGQVLPECITNYMPDVLIPTPFLLKYLDIVAARYLCRYQNEFFFDVGYCETNQWNFYPSIKDELAPISKNETVTLQKFCVMQNVCNGFFAPNPLHKRQNASISIRPLEDQFVLVYLKKSFCENFLYRFIKILQKLPFYEACLHKCQKTVRINSLIKCFRRHYRLYQQTAISIM